jgi:signal transduction histidine kinase
MIGVVFIAPVFTLFCASFVKVKLSSLIHIINYLFGFVFILFIYTPLFAIGGEDFLIFHGWPRPGPLFHLVLTYFGINVIFGHILLFKKYRAAKESIIKNQIIYILLGAICGFLGGSVNFLLWYRIPLLPVTTILVSLWAPLTAYGILRFRLMDIKLVIKRTMAYSLSAGLLMAFFIVIVLSITDFLSAYTDVDSLKVSIFAAFVIALLFNPLRNKVQILVDNIFYMKTYDYYDTIQKVSHNLATMFNVNEIHSYVGDMILTTVGLKSIFLLSATPGEDYGLVHARSFRRKVHEGVEGLDEGYGTIKILKDSELIQMLIKSGDILIKDELAGTYDKPDHGVVSDIEHTLNPFKGEAVVPIFVDGKLMMLFILGEKLSGDIFSQEDINLINTISHQTSIALKNARLYSEKITAEKLASIGMVSATFAHEIRNPLTSIKTFAQLIPEKYTDKEFREHFSKIVVDEIERIDSLIKDLMSFSSKHVSFPENELDITELVDETVDHLKVKLELENKSIDVEKCYNRDKIKILGDSKKLKQAFANILNNGCQAITNEGLLKVNINPNGQKVDVSITDSGKGISQGEIVNIFEPFYTTKPMGVGLGLAISKKIIEDHGGRIAVESKLLQGTTFTVSIPKHGD